MAWSRSMMPGLGNPGRRDLLRRESLIARSIRDRAPEPREPPESGGKLGVTELTRETQAGPRRPGLKSSKKHRLAPLRIGRPPRPVGIRSPDRTELVSGDPLRCLESVSGRGEQLRLRTGYSKAGGRGKLHQAQEGHWTVGNWGFQKCVRTRTDPQ